MPLLGSVSPFSDVKARFRAAQFRESGVLTFDPYTWHELPPIGLLQLTELPFLAVSPTAARAFVINRFVAISSDWPQAVEVTILPGVANHTTSAARAPSDVS